MASDDLCWLPALELASLIRAKKVSPVEVTDAVLARIERDDFGLLEPRAEPGQGARVHGLDDDTIRACVSS